MAIATIELRITASRRARNVDVVGRRVRSVLEAKAGAGIVEEARGTCAPSERRARTKLRKRKKRKGKKGERRHSSESSSCSSFSSEDHSSSDESSSSYE